jgi:hypothetical protein
MSALKGLSMGMGIGLSFIAVVAFMAIAIITG